MTSALLLLLLLAQAAGPEVQPEAAPAAAPARRWHALTRGEASALTLPPREGGGPREGFVQVEPTLVVDGARRGRCAPGAFASLGLGVDDAR